MSEGKGCYRLDARIEGIIRRVVESIKKKFGDNLKGVVLYGSWVKGEARENSDIDLLVIFKKMEKGLREKVYQIIEKSSEDRVVSVVVTSETEFEEEKLPLFTAVKKEGVVLEGEVNMKISPISPAKKYQDFFRKSGEFERRKVDMAEEFLKKGFSSSVAINCYIASKHAFQVGLAMKGVGFSSKFPVLARWVREYYGEEWENMFRKLFEYYVKSEYEMEELSEEEGARVIGYARKIMERVYKSHPLS